MFDRSQQLPSGAHLEQADGTAWMAFYCATMLSMALELARTDPAYEDMASKFFEHFIHIADAMNSFGGTGLWDEADGFYYDRLHVDGSETALRVRSLVACCRSSPSRCWRTRSSIGCRRSSGGCAGSSTTGAISPGGWRWAWAAAAACCWRSPRAST
jgi:hypothetical protein